MIHVRIDIQTKFDAAGFIAFAADYFQITAEVNLNIYPGDKLLDRFSQDGYEYRALLYKPALPWQYNLVLRSDMGEAEIPGILAHEMVHLNQYITGRLNMNMTTGAAVWKGEIYAAAYPYEKRPWEKEAFKEQKRLLKAWKKNSHK